MSDDGEREASDEARGRAASVTNAGERLHPQIDGVKIRPAKTQTDARGTVTEIYDPRWGFTDDPMVYAYLITIRPGMTKGWVLHRHQDDRLFFLGGTLRVVLFDDRPESPTRGMVNELYFDPHNRGLLRIPVSVWHAVTNVGTDDATMINHPTQPYDHADPDKWDLPADTPSIPFDLGRRDLPPAG